LASSKSLLALATLLLATTAQAGGVTGGMYSNFGLDLMSPIFPHGGTLAVYARRGDSKPREVLKDTPVLRLFGDVKRCLKAHPDGWAYCELEGFPGWVKRADFGSGADVAPTKQWPFRYWIHIASDTSGAEETSALLDVLPKVPYLVLPREFENILFYVRFDSEGNAISPRTGKFTGDRIFVVNDAVYLAPADSAKRERANWLLLGFYNEGLRALCPGRSADSCMSAVNLAPGWQGIKAMYTQPPQQFARKEMDGRWYGPGEVGFARHTDPVQPLMYRVPEEVPMRADRNARSDADRAKNRAKLFCIADCGSATIDKPAAK
jgi:hypothetical protein